MQVGQYSKQIQHLKGLIGEERKKVEMKVRQVEGMEEKISELGQKREALEWEWREQRRVSSELQQQAESQNEVRQALLQQATTKSQDLSALKLNVNELERQLFRRQQELEKIRQRKFQKIQCLYQMRRTLTAASAEVQSYKNQHEKQAQQLALLRSTNAAVLQDITNLRHKKANKSSQINVTQCSLIERLNHKQDQIQQQRQWQRKTSQAQSLLLLVATLQQPLQKQLCRSFLRLMQRPIAQPVLPLLHSLKLTSAPFQRLLTHFVREATRRHPVESLRPLRVQLHFFRQFRGVAHLKQAFHRLEKSIAVKKGHFHRLKRIHLLGKRRSTLPSILRSFFSRWKHTSVALPPYDAHEDTLKHKLLQAIANHLSVQRCRHLFLLWSTFHRLVPSKYRRFLVSKDLSHKILLRWAHKTQNTRRHQAQILVQEQATYNDELASVEHRLQLIRKNPKRLLVIAVRARNFIKRQYLMRWRRQKVDGRELVRCFSKVERRMKAEVLGVLREMMVELLESWIAQGQDELEEQRGRMEGMNKEIVETQLAQEYLTLKRWLQMTRKEHSVREAVRRWRKKCGGGEGVVLRRVVGILRVHALKAYWGHLIN